MSIPTSMTGGPFTATVLVKKRYLLFHFFLIWISIIPLIFEFWIYFRLLYFWKPLHFFIFLPFLLFLMYLSAVFTALLFAKLLLIIVNAFHKPREGIFLRDPSVKDYRYWSMRNTIKRWPIWLSHKFPFPFLDNLCFKVFGVKTPFTNALFEGWVDTEFVEFGKNVVVGQGSIIQSTSIIGNFLIIKKTVIEDDVRIGSHAVVMPGTHVGNKCALNSWSMTVVDQDLEDGWIYLGNPAKKFKKNRFFEEGLEEKIMGPPDSRKMHKKYEEYIEKAKHEKQTIIEKFQKYRDTREEEKRRLEEMGGFSED